MNVRVDVSGHVEVDDRPDVRDVQTSGGDVGRDQDRKLLLLERVDDLVSLVLKSRLINFLISSLRVLIKRAFQFA